MFWSTAAAWCSIQANDSLGRFAREVMPAFAEAAKVSAAE